MAKGGQFERDIAKKLSLWWTGEEDDNVFWRTQNSGGRATIRRKKGKETTGDVSDLKATNPIGQPLMDFFAMELKTGYKDAILQDLFFHAENKPAKKRSCWWNWIRQAIRARKNSGTFSWCLIVKRPSRKPLIMVPLEDLFAASIFDVAVPIENHLVIDVNDRTFLVAQLDDFLSRVTPSKIKNFIKWKKRSKN